MTNHTEHKYTAESLLQAIDELGKEFVASLDPIARMTPITVLAAVLRLARDLDTARPKPAHTDVAAKLAEALREPNGDLSRVRNLVELYPCECGKESAMPGYTITECSRCGALNILRRFTESFAAIDAAQAQREGAQVKG